ncbi:methionyl-tRNA formyltransferase [Luteitalea sp. TBR-22]|uniref:methionyl-tRNA formyltransferase n=1 Tax=Luteitalea sp. TBR-22 TaxID=2802971 RepID=UPI001EF60186|nr:methionyl-tRNA formyltransferase [Luteitalea sp. TBR-22]
MSTTVPDMPLRIAFFGTPAFAVPTLDALLASSHEVVGVVTQPDRPRGRGQQVSDAPVKERAVVAGVPILQPTRLKDPVFLDAFRAWNADLGVVAAYGRLLPQVLLDIPPRGLLNVHASLLPAWRGASPIQRAVLNGDAVSGVTIMRVVLALDAGAMLARVEVPVSPDDTSGSLEARLAVAGASLLRDVVDRIGRGESVEEVPQDDAAATLAPRLEKQEGLIDWTRSAWSLDCHVRGMQPWPSAFTYVDGQRLVVREARADDTPAGDVPPGGLVRVDGDAALLACGDGRCLRVSRVQPEGKRAMTTREWLQGRRAAEPLRAGMAP